ncbi:MAG: N-formylglutamate amidohydrolase, partial [Clostridia bacterium]|nr:N-formylglutamate amidohydrolase [Deltaproteobacteria bacterium]
DGDGLTTTLRQAFDPKRYAGIEIEVNQKYPRRYAAGWTHLQDLVTSTFGRVLNDLGR